MVEKRKGNQYPTQSHTIEYNRSKGQEAINLYNSTGRTAQEWQELLLYDILAINDEDLYVHTKFGYSVPRRNGKNEVVTIREMYGLTIGEHILHTAHRTTTTHSAWERLYDLLTKANITITSSYRAFGKEHIEVEGGGKIEFRTRTSKGGLGEGFDLLIIDEAQEYQDDQESALKYVVSDSQNPQTLFCGTPPTAVSSGTVFTKLRANVLRGSTPNAGWAEWSVDKQSDPNDKELWYMTNPSLGTVLTERKILDEIGSDVIDFNIQRLGLWMQSNLKSAISEAEWMDLRVKEAIKLKGKLFVGIKYGNDGINVALSVAVKTNTEKIFVEGYDVRSIRDGNGWIIDFLKSARIEQVVVDGASGQNLLVSEMKSAKLKEPICPKVAEIITANSTFEQSIYSQSICHKGQPSMVQVISNCDKRAIGSNGGFGYKAIKEGIEIALLDSMILANWACSNFKEKKKQKIYC